MKFDGKGFAREIEKQVKLEVSKLPKAPRVVSVLVGENLASELYTRLKKAAAERVGIQFEVARLSSELTVESIKKELENIGKENKVDGVIVQLPIPGLTKGEQESAMEMIPLEKDVDGLRYPESEITPATPRAIMRILDKIAEQEEVWSKQFVVVGDRGSVGKPLVSVLEKRRVKVLGINSETEGTELVRRLLEGEVIISCTGREGLITKEMVRDGLIAIDVGAPRGEMSQEVYEKAKVSVEVPGGVGPVTVASLMANVIECVGYKTKINI